MCQIKWILPPPQDTGSIANKFNTVINEMSDFFCIGKQNFWVCWKRSNVR